MSGEDPALRRYRRFLMVFVLVAGLIVMIVGGGLVLHGKFFEAFLAMLVLGFLMLLLRGYRQDEEERNR